jgi:hypothetical protein
MAKNMRIIQMVSDFLTWLFEETEVQDAQKWINLAKKGITERQWEIFCRLAPTENTLGEIAELLVSKTPKAVAAMSTDEREQAFEDARTLLVEICEKADEIGVELELKRYLKFFHAVA